MRARRAASAGFENLPLLDDYRIKPRCCALPLRGPAAQRLDQAPVRLLRSEPEDGREPRGAAGAASEHAEAPGVALDLVEQQRRRQVLLDVQLADRAELQVPVGAAHLPELAQVADLLDPRTQVERVHAGHYRFNPFGGGLRLTIREAKQQRRFS